MKIRGKLIFLLSSLIFIFLFAFILFRNNERKKLVLLFEKEVEDRKSTFDTLLTLKGKSSETLAFDYTYWDEMVDFVNSDDDIWGKETIDTCLSTYDVDAVWIYRPDFSFRYSATNAEEDIFKELPFPKEVLEKIFYQNKFCHFFISSERGSVIEIYGASIHPGNDAKRETPAQGYFFNGKTWDDAYITELSELTNTEIAVKPVSEKERFMYTINPENGIISFSRILSDWRGSPLLHLDILTTSKTIKNFNLMSNKYFLMLLVSSGVIIIIFAIFIMGWIGAPLHLISRSLRTEDRSYINKLDKDRTEFGDIARLIDKFFKQRNDLLNEMSERLKITEALRVSKESFHNIVERSADGIVIADTNGVVRFINLAAHSFLGRKYLLDKPFIYPIKKNETMEISIICANGEKGVGEVRIAETEWEGMPSYLISIIDITREKQLEKTRRLAELGKLVADMAHEVNNPLMVISGNAQISLMENIDNPEIKNNLEIIFKESQRAKGIIQRLLKFSRTGREQPKEADINRVLEEVIVLLEHQFSLDNVEIKRNYAENLPLVAVDAQQMQEVFINLLNNARDAMTGGGLVEVATSRQGDFLRIDFKDTGSGMSEDVKERVFEPFFTTKEKGTGLGLSLCYSIIKAHSGELKIESSMGKGTAVSILLPLKEAKENV